MNEQRQFVITGVLWTAIAFGVGYGGVSLTDSGGFLSVIGWGLAIVGFGFSGMSLWALVAGNPGSRSDTEVLGAYASAMDEMADEAERTHREMVETYISDVSNGVLDAPRNQPPTGPSAKGVFKSRYIGALHIAVAYGLSSNDQDHFDDLLQISSGCAIEPFAKDEFEDLALSRKKAKTIANRNTPKFTKSIKWVIEHSPIGPGCDTDELQNLIDAYHEALADSIGAQAYDDNVRDRFDHLIRMGRQKAASHAAKWASQ